MLISAVAIPDDTEDELVPEVVLVQQTNFFAAVFHEVDALIEMECVDDGEVFSGNLEMQHLQQTMVERALAVRLLSIFKNNYNCE